VTCHYSVGKAQGEWTALGGQQVVGGLQKVATLACQYQSISGTCCESRRCLTGSEYKLARLRRETTADKVEAMLWLKLNSKHLDTFGGRVLASSSAAAAAAAAMAANNGITMV
jgi:hypothetical protein